MTENRLFAGWLRSLSGLVAVAGALGLSACGGGSGAPNNPFIGTLTVSPASTITYSGTPTTLTISGGTGPYRAFSSNSTLLPVPQTVPEKSVVLLADTVEVETTVTITIEGAPPVQGGVAAQVPVTVTVRPAPLVNLLTLKADSFRGDCPNPGGSASAVDAQGQTFICAGQTGSIAVRLKNTVGGGLAGRQIRFDVVQGDFEFFTNAPGQSPTYALSYTVPTDQNGDAIARVHALPNGNHQIVIVQATDVLTGTFVRGIFIVTNGEGLLIVPSTVAFTGPDSQTCAGPPVSASFFIFGGLPPYTLSNTAPQFLAIAPSVVNASGSGFNVTPLGCLDPGIIAITDAAGHTSTVSITNKVGSGAPSSTTTPNPIVITPSAIPKLSCGEQHSIVLTGGGTTTQSGGTTTVTPAKNFLVSVSRPDAVSVVPSSPNAGAGIVLTRLANTPSITLNPATVTLTIYDGNQILTKTVQVDATCP